MTKKNLTRVGLIALICSIFFAYKWLGLDHFLSLESLKSNQVALSEYYASNTLLVSSIYVLIYVISTAISLPGAAILTLAGGAIFGLWVGTFLVSVASTFGATLAFLVTRFFLKDFVQSKFRAQLQSFNRGFEKDGAFYLLTLRLVPIFPFFIINLLMGLTPIGTATYFFISLVGMLPGTAVYVNAGTQLAQVESLKGILSPELIASFALIGVLPIVSRRIVNIIKARKYLGKFRKPKKFDYNIIVIGGGSAGLVSAYIASALKAKVALIEKHKMGGDCLNTGCVPSKALIRSAKILNYFSRAKEFGIESLSSKVNFSQVMERVQKVIEKIEPHDSVERYTALGADCISGAATIKSPYEVEVNGKVLTTRNIVIATGATPLVPPLPGLSAISYLTSDNVWNLRELPRRLVVLGGGPIGCELAQSFARFGSQVILVEMASRIMTREDGDVSELIADKFKSEGIRVLTSHKALRVENNPKALICEHDGDEIKIEFDEILLALGRKANVSGFGLEKLNVEVSNQGTIVSDEFMRTTNYPNIFVCGDVTGPYQFTHVAAYQAWYVAVNALFNPFKMYKVDYSVIPWCTFTDLEVARVGLNELEAKERGIQYQVAKYEIDDLDRAIAEGEARGFVKVLTPQNSDKIIGATIVGHHAGDIIVEYVAAMKHGFGLNKILNTIHIYPTLAEANKYAAGVWKKNNAPQGLLKILKKYHTWRRS